LIDPIPAKCPFCGQAIDEALAAHIRAEHQAADQEASSVRALQQQCEQVERLLDEMEQRVRRYDTNNVRRLDSLLAAKDKQAQLDQVLAKQPEHLESIRAATLLLGNLRTGLAGDFEKLIESFASVRKSLKGRAPAVETVEGLGTALVSYVASARKFLEEVDRWSSKLADADQVLRHELDLIAGTEDVSTLIGFLEAWPKIEKYLRVAAILGGLSQLRRDVERFISEEVDRAISGSLTAEVMEWYEEIRTNSDPDVHFNGFGLEQTAKGEFRTRRIAIIDL
jgi:chromosome segregation ATPase